MGMFDSLYDANGNEWQTKAYDRTLERYTIGDTLPGPTIPYQVEVCGGAGPTLEDAYATIRGGVLISLPDKRDGALPLLRYHAHYNDELQPAIYETDS